MGKVSTYIKERGMEPAVEFPMRMFSEGMLRIVSWLWPWPWPLCFQHGYLVARSESGKPTTNVGMNQSFPLGKKGEGMDVDGEAV